MYDKRAKQDALDLWFSMPGETSVDDFAAELGYPSGSTLRNWIKADPRQERAWYQGLDNSGVTGARVRGDGRSGIPRQRRRVNRDYEIVKLRKGRGARGAKNEMLKKFHGPS